MAAESAPEPIVIATAQAPTPVGPYSQAVRVGNLLFCSGQLGIDPATGALVAGVEAQADQVLKNLSAVLEAAGSSLRRIVKTTIFVKDLKDFAAINAIYGGYLGAPPPARSTIEVARLPLDGLVEIEAIALVD